MSTVLEVVKEVPIFALVMLVMLICALVGYLAHEKVTIRFGRLSIESQTKIIHEKENQEVRQQIYLQIREYENYIGRIEIMLVNSFYATFPEMSQGERNIARMFCNSVRRGLEKQLILDFIANHITTKSEEELNDYVSTRVDGYKNRIAELLSTYNELILPGKDITSVVESLDRELFENLFRTIYSKAILVVRDDLREKGK